MDETRAFLGYVTAGDRANVEQLLAEKPELAAVTSDSGVSALLLAIYYGKPEIAQVLAAHHNNLSLFEAAALGDDQRARAILTAEPECIDLANVDGFTPLGLAAFFGHADVVDLLLGLGATVDLPSRNGQHVTPLNSAAAGQHGEVARMLIEHGADVNARQEGGFTPIHSAAQNGDLELVQLLLEHGADPHATTDDGKTALDFARESRNEAVIQLLSSDM